MRITASAVALAMWAFGGVMAQDVDAAVETAAVDDPRQWLEEVEGEAALNQVRAWNQRTLDALTADPRFAELEAEALAIVNATDKIPYGAYRGGWVYNFWQDETHVRGLVRRATLESYLADDIVWETLLDVDALAEAEGKNWVYKGSDCLAPTYERCILTLSDGGKDAAVRREWDHAAKSFVDGGFALPEAKAGTAWKDVDTLLVATDWGEGTTTESGYPYIVKSLARGQALGEASEIIRGEPTDVGVWPFVIEGDDGERIAMAARAVTFFESESWLLPDGGAPVKLPLPAKHTLQALFDGQLVFTIEEAWTPAEGGPTYPQGALLAFDFAAFRASGELPAVETILVPSARMSIEGVSRSKSKLHVAIYENVVGRIEEFTRVDGAWTATPVALPTPEPGSVGVVSAYQDSDVVFASFQNFIQPDTLYALDRAGGAALGQKSAPARFEAGDLNVTQETAVSKDGTEIPYFLITKKDLPRDGSTPTLLYGYGGFQVSLTPSYSGIRGKLWLERGGALAIANIRGGGEFGPAWHQAGLKTERQRIYDDFIAVAEKLIADRVTSNQKLGVMGGSNGGLLMGVMYTQRPDLFGAIVCQVPLLDMLRYHLLLAGASWIGEYGDPDVADERAFLETISPYANVKPDATYPPIFFVTSTKDDRVHPGHARKMAALLESYGYAFDYYENIDGGHSAAANLKETAKRTALEYTWLSQKLMD